MLRRLPRLSYILVAFTVLGGCSVVFGSDDSKPSEGDVADARPGSITEARIGVSEPACGDNVYSISGVGSPTAGGTTISELRWTIVQGSETLASFSGSADDPVDTSTHVLGGTMGTFNLNPSLLSAPDMLRVSISGTADVNQVYQRNLLIPVGENYEVSFVASSDSPGKVRAALLENTTPFGLMGLSELFDTDSTPTRYVFEFETTRASVDGRFRFEFPQQGSFWIDNVQLRQVGKENVLENYRFGPALEPWALSLAGGNGNTAVIESIPLALTTFQDMTLNLVVVDSSGSESEVGTTTIEWAPCE